MGKRQDESSKGKSIRSKKAAAAKSKTSRTTAAKAKTKTMKTTRALSPSEVIMTMTLEDAKKLQYIFDSARSRRAPSRGHA